MGRCWTVVHGNHRLVVPATCSYCRNGLNKKRQLGSPRPRDEVAKRVEDNQDAGLGKMLEETLEGVEADCGNSYSLEDVMSTDWSDFDLSNEMEWWNVDPFLVEGGGSSSILEEPAQ